MNIFVTDPCPIISAQALDNKRIVKMVLETAQLLSSAIFINSGILYDEIYRPTHKKHPCTIWTSSSLGNWEWLLEHFVALCQEYTYRYNKRHSSKEILPYLIKYRAHIQKGPMTSFANCARSKALQIDFRELSNTCAAYRQYLIAKWNNDKIPPNWSHRGPPLWRTVL